MAGDEWNFRTLSEHLDAKFAYAEQIQTERFAALEKAMLAESAASNVKIKSIEEKIDDLSTRADRLDGKALGISALTTVIMSIAALVVAVLSYMRK